MKIKNLLKFIIVGFSLTSVLFGQNDISKIHPLSNSFLLSIEGGGNFPFTDYETPEPNISIGIDGKYFFSTNSNNVFGINLNLSQQTLSGTKNNLGLPSNFNSLVRRIGVGITYSSIFKENILPYISAGMSYLWLGFDSQNQKSRFYNIQNGGEKNSLSFDMTGGLKFKINEDFDFNIGITYHYIQNDNIDAIKFGKYEDFYLTGLVGFSYRLWNEKDSDQDGILDDEDKCPYQEEDLDGYQDYDGCPDPDNDGDGILDIDDTCQNIAEDFDGYQDSDGCPDLDNDGDGIEDSKDGCPDSAEDFDGFEDEDGCPDPDNDKDGIVDSKDLCPNQAEVFNGFKDEDGCPDVAPKSVKKKKPKQVNVTVTPKPKKESKSKKAKYSSIPRQFLIHSETTFASSHSSQIKSSAFGELNRIVTELKKYPKARWRIEGHIDKQTSRTEANRVTKSQADAILSYLVSKGLSASNFQSMGLGDSSPIASNTSVYGKMKNRRIIIRKID